MNPQEKFWKMVEASHVAMLTTLHEGKLDSRPMAPFPDRDEGVIHFITRRSTSAAGDVSASVPVNVSWADPSREDYVSLGGTARVTQNREKLRSLWNSWAEAYLPEGPDGADTALLTVVPDEAVYWDGTSSRIVEKVKTLSATVTGSPPNLGERQHVKL